MILARFLFTFLTSSIFKVQEDYCLRHGSRRKLYWPKSIGNHLRYFKIVDNYTCTIHIYITYIFMPLQGELQGEGSTSSELIQVAVCVFEKNCISWLGFQASEIVLQLLCLLLWSRKQSYFSWTTASVFLRTWLLNLNSELTKLIETTCPWVVRVLKVGSFSVYMISKMLYFFSKLSLVDSISFTPGSSVFDFLLSVFLSVLNDINALKELKFKRNSISIS